MEQLIEALIARREELDCSMTKAAEVIGCKQPTYLMWEKGVYEPGWEWIDGIARFLDRTKPEVLILMGVLSEEDLRGFCVLLLDGEGDGTPGKVLPQGGEGDDQLAARGNKGNPGDGLTRNAETRIMGGTRAA